MDRTNRVPEHIQCKICNNFYQFSIRINNVDIVPPEFKILWCPLCNTSAAIEIENISEKNQRYDSIYKSLPLGYQRYKRYQYEVKLRKDPLRYLAKKEPQYFGLKQALLKAPKNPRILEIGCGLGYLTYSLNVCGYVTDGIDISESAILSAKETFPQYSSKFKYLTLADIARSNAEYDLIIATEVIEHIKNPIEMVCEMKSILTKNGMLYLTTPDKTSVPLDIAWATDPPPIHYWWFSESSISFIANRLNLAFDPLDLHAFYKNRFSSLNITYHRKRQNLPIDLEHNAGSNTIKYLVIRRIESLIKYVKTMLGPIKLRMQSKATLLTHGDRGTSLCFIFTKNL